MAFYLVHAGTNLYKVDVSGGVTPLALPSGVTLSSTRRARFATLNRAVVMVHAPSRPIQIDPTLVVRPLTPRPPTTDPTVTVSGSGSFTGTYGYLVTFAIRTGSRLISESPSRDDPSLVTASGHAQFNLTNLPISSDPAVNTRRIWRTTAGAGSVYYLAATIADNTTTSYVDSLPDSGLAVNDTLADDLGEPMGNASAAEYFEQIIAWKDRLWAFGNTTPDRVFYSGHLRPWAWDAEAFVTAKPEGQDLEGASGFAARRDELVIGKRRSLWKVIGDGPENFQMIQIVEGTGIWAAESVVVIRDTAYFLAEDGVYSYGAGGLTNLSKERVHAWFTTDAYFNRATFPRAFAKWNQRYNLYELHLGAVGSEDINRWVALDLDTGAWFGPHKTDAFTPTCAGVIEDDDGIARPVLGGADGVLYRQQEDLLSDAGVAIDLDVTTKWHSQGAPARDKYWGELTVHTRPEASGTLTITPRVGSLDAVAGPAISHALTAGTRTHRRLGVGPFLQLRFRNAEVNQNVELRGYEVDPVADLGNRRARG
ncbi:MAG: hypothetical protein QN178_14080 [Armatimonadota bacterium]|nr:hypothetical protein [Armatimonadota bacterium]